MPKPPVLARAWGLERKKIYINVIVPPKAHFNQVFRQAKRCKTTDLITGLFSCPVAAVLLQIEAKVQASILQGGLR